MKKVTITWTPDDVQTLRPELTDEQAENMLDKIEKMLVVTSVELGWDTMECAIQVKEDEDKTS